MSPRKVLAQDLYLPDLEFTPFHTAPEITGTDERGIHQFEYRALTEGM